MTPSDMHELVQRAAQLRHDLGSRQPTRFYWNPASFLLGTIDMTDAEVGKYMRLLMRQYERGSVEARLVTSSQERVREKFHEVGGLFFNRTALLEYVSAAAALTKNRGNGRLGGRPGKPTGLSDKRGEEVTRQEATEGSDRT